MARIGVCLSRPRVGLAWSVVVAVRLALLLTVTIHEYQKALNKLEGLVVQRLFELSKMGLSGTGMSFIAYCTCLMHLFTFNVKGIR